MDNLAYKYEDAPYEIFDGQVRYMAQPSRSHARAGANIYRVLDNFLFGKRCEAFMDSMTVFADEKNRFIPDVCVVCDEDKVLEDGIYGAPDLVVEALSPSTEKDDRVHKMRVYERAGVREYWLVNPKSRSVEVYLLKDGAFVLDAIYYHKLPAWEYELADEEKRKEMSRQEFKTSLFDDLVIKLDDVFYRVNE